MPTRFLKVKEVAKLLNISDKTVYKIKEEIPGYFKLAKMHFFDEEVLLMRLKELATLTNKPIQPNKINRKCHDNKSDRHGLGG